jgi:hypothetical protein
VLLGDASAIDLMRRLGNANGALPFSVLLDRRGRLKDRKLGAYSATDLNSAVVGLLQ